MRYDGDPADTVINLPGTPGDFPYMLLNNIYAPGNTFAPGDVIAGRLAVPQGIQVEVRQQQQGYYMQFVPVLQQFQDYIRAEGVKHAELRMGEDVVQLDMIGCASPHWNKDFLGGSPASIATIVDNCVTKNAWAIKQMVQSRPAILYIVSVSSWHMFYNAFGTHVQRDTPLPDRPADNDYTLLRETTDPAHPAYINFDVTVDGQRYQHKVRLVITPHFSYNTNFQPQYRMPKADWESLLSAQPGFKAALDAHPEYFSVPPPKYENGYIALMLPGDPATAKLAMAILQGFPVAWEALQPRFYDLAVVPEPGPRDAEARARPRLRELHLRLDRQPGHGDLHPRDRGHVAGVRAGHGDPAGRPARRRRGPVEGRAGRRHPALAGLSSRSCCRCCGPMIVTAVVLLAIAVVQALRPRRRA